jgi:hypothetical protein
MATDPCPICGTPVYVWERYPKALCNACVALARDEQGRPMRFGNETLLGTGFVAEVEVEDVWRRVDDGDFNVTCWVEGRRCVAAEHRFGGIVVQTLD